MYSNLNLEQVQAGTMQAFIFLLIIGVGLCQNITNESIINQAVWENDIKEQYKFYSNHFKKGDFISLETLFTDDCIMMPPGSPLATGKEVFEEFAKARSESGVHDIVITSIEVTAEKRRLALSRGSYFLRTVDKTVVDVGKFLILWKRVKGVPKIYTDIWNSNRS